MPNNNNHKIDFIRFVAIFAVVVVHVSSEYLPILSVKTLSWWVMNITQIIAKVAVPLFLMISGYLLLDEKKNYTIKSFYSKRISKIGIPLLFWPFLYYFGFLFVSGKNLHFFQFANDFFFLDMFYHLYFLYIILGLYLLTPFLRKILQNCNFWEKSLFISLSFLFSIITTFFVYWGRINYWSVVTVSIPFIAYFVTGDYLKKFHLDNKKKNILFVVFILLVLLTSTTKYWAYMHNSKSFIRYLDDVLSLNVILTSMTAFIYLMNSELSSVFNKKVISKIAENSFGIYLIHPIILYSLNLVTKNIKTFHLPIAILKIFLVFLLSFITVILVRKIKFISKLFGN